MRNLLILIFVLILNSPVRSQSPAEQNCCSSRIKSARSFLKFLSQNRTENNTFKYDISYHHLEFEVDPSVLYIKGSVTTYFTPSRPDFNEISFDLSSSLDVDSVKYHNKKVIFSRPKDLLTIELIDTLPENRLDSVSVFYQGQPVSSGFGSFVQSFHNGFPIIWTLSEPYGAKDWWPCKQSLDDKADSIDMFVVSPSEDKVAGNGVLVSEKILNEKKITHWKHRHPIAAYLIAFAVTNYAAYSDYAKLSSGDSLQILNYVYPENLENAQISTPKLIPVLQMYNRLFGVYPFADEKYGHAQFGWGGGMEHQTMTFLSHFNVALTAHELAHQWFGDDITCGSWHDIWLNEGFATYCEGLTTENGLNDDGQTFTQWKTGRINSITQKDDGSVFVDDTSSVSRIFDSRLSYSKGAMVLHQLRKKIGNEAFFNGIREYRNDKLLSKKYALTHDLKKHFESACNCNLDTFFEQWIYGEGFPIYTLKYSQTFENIVKLTVNQKQSTPKAIFFPMKIAVQFVGYSRDTTILFNNLFSGQEYIFDPGFKILSIVFDPEHDIISSRTRYYFENASRSDLTLLVPNPTSDSFTVLFPTSYTFNSVKIFDISGKFVENFSPGNYNDRFTFDISHLKPGEYFIEFSNEKLQITKKVIKN
jgi:aminopeptidase N